MFKFFDRKGKLIFESESLEEVEEKAGIFKKENNLLTLQIYTGSGLFFKWAN